MDFLLLARRGCHPDYGLCADNQRVGGFWGMGRGGVTRTYGLGAGNLGNYWVWGSGPRIKKIVDLGLGPRPWAANPRTDVGWTEFRRRLYEFARGGFGVRAFADDLQHRDRELVWTSILLDSLIPRNRPRHG